MEYILLENHFWVPNNEIRSFTRNKSWEDITFIIQEIASILYPNLEIEVLFLPTEKGSYRDIAKIISKHPLWTFNVLIALWTITFWILTYIDTHEEHLHNEKNWVLDDTKKCIEFKKMLYDYKNEWIEIDWINDNKIKEVCGNVKIKKSKNDFIKTLKKDDMISDDEIILLNNSNKIIKNHKIERKNFDKYIEYVSENEEYIKDNIEWVIELISPVVRQKKEWKWIPWKWIYYWKDIFEKWIEILLNWEEINFYMQDMSFKKKIKNHKVTFWSWDNIKSIFTLKCLLKIDIVQNKSIYIKQVKKLNDDIFEYKEILIKKKNKVSKNILTLF